VTEENKNPTPEVPEPPEAKKPAGAVPPPPPKPAGTVPPPPPKPAAPAAPPKPKRPVPEPWSHPIVDALKEKFGGEILKSYSFLGQNQIEVKKARLVEIMTFLRNTPLGPFNY